MRGLRVEVPWVSTSGMPVMAQNTERAVPVCGVKKFSK
jgi:hypothetical protein